MSTKNPKLIITVDNGISNVDEVKFINSFNRDIIITDHHEAPDILPNAYAIINPKSINALDEKLTTLQIEYLTSLAGVGVAFKLAQGVLEKYNKLDYSYELLPYVTVGTIADLVPLIGENRYFVTKGLELIVDNVPIANTMCYMAEFDNNDYRLVLDNIKAIQPFNNDPQIFNYFKMFAEKMLKDINAPEAKVSTGFRYNIPIPYKNLNSKYINILGTSRKREIRLDTVDTTSISPTEKYHASFYV